MRKSFFFVLADTDMLNQEYMRLVYVTSFFNHQKDILSNNDAPFPYSYLVYEVILVYQESICYLGSSVEMRRECSYLYRRAWPGGEGVSNGIDTTEKPSPWFKLDLNHAWAIVRISSLSTKVMTHLVSKILKSWH